ncbi:tetratricopeptide repeat protein [bacterium]|nr:tetratricopeptide repeat protein [bacterium]
MIFRFKFKKLWAIRNAVFWLFVCRLIAESPYSSVFRTADLFEKEGAYDQAITEYLRFQFLEKDSRCHSRVFFRIGSCYAELNQFENALDYFNLALQMPNDSTMRSRIHISKAAIYIVQGRCHLAQRILLKHWSEDHQDSLNAQAGQLLLISAISQGDWIKSLKYYSMLYKRCQSCPDEEFVDLLKKAGSIKPKSESRAKWLSVLIPGLGQIYAGEYGNAFNAFVLNGLNFYLTGYLMDLGRMNDALLYTILLTQRFYFGNIYQAQEAVKRVNLRQQDEIRNELLDKVEGFQKQNF